MVTAVAALLHEEVGYSIGWLMHYLKWVEIYKREFTGYNLHTFYADLTAGLTVAAVGLPLALAFGVACGASAASGLVTAIMAGLIIGGLSGAPYQISGPTGAMTAILIAIVAKEGLIGAWFTGLLAGIFILIVGLLKLGRFIGFISTPVITGFTSGIALIIVLGQLSPFLGIHTEAGESPLRAAITLLYASKLPDWHAMLIGGVVMAAMVWTPKSLSQWLPGSLLGIMLATLLADAWHWDIARIGAIPRSVWLQERLSIGMIPWERLNEFILPAFSVAALGAVESLLCGAVGSKMTGVRLHANEELVAQGIGNIAMPFFGGVPATAAIARTSVGIKSGGKTRLVSIIHALVLVACVFLLAPIISRIPLSALAGVLIVTAWRMNEWETIRFFFARRFKSAILKYFVTLLATVTLDLTQAIVIGVTISAAMFINRIANMRIDVHDVDAKRLQERGIKLKAICPHVRVAYLSGPLFFGAVNTFNEVFAHLERVHVLILSMRSVPLIDVSGLEALAGLVERLHSNGQVLMLAGVQPEVLAMLERSGLDVHIGKENFFWGTDQALIAAEERHTCPYCAQEEEGQAGVMPF